MTGIDNDKRDFVSRVRHSFTFLWHPGTFRQQLHPHETHEHNRETTPR